tara:strand:+ start:393 stop:1619 length:1227 start_codon:yes stop_codon:yes gene_type:complete
MGIFEHITVNDYVAEESYSERVYLQFYVGHVDFVISHRKNPLYTQPKDINAILVKEYKSNDMSQGKFNAKYYPLLRGVVDTPMPGDQVLLCQFGGENYYLGPLNTLNKPNFNIDHLLKSPTADSGGNSLKGIHDVTNIKHTHKISNIARLEKQWIQNLDDPDNEYEGKNPNMSSEEYSKTHQIGDMYLEGRYGNSIRIGGRKSNPNIVISNGRVKKGVKPAACIRETLADTSLLSMTQKGKLSDYYCAPNKVYNPSCMLTSLTTPDTLDAPRKINYDSEYEGPQTILASKKIILDNRSPEPMVISSFGDMEIGSAGNINVKVTDGLEIDSRGVWLGGSDASEPLVLGDELVAWLEQLVDQIAMITVAPCSPGGASGPPVNGSAISGLKSSLKNIITDYAYVRPKAPTK